MLSQHADIVVITCMNGHVFHALEKFICLAIVLSNDIEATHM